MSNYAIFTDSASDLSAKMLAELDVTSLPLSFVIGENTYLNHADNRDMSPADFYAALKNGAMATTSAVNVQQYLDEMEPVLQAGRDILVIAFSAALSTTCQSAQIAADELGERYPDRKILVVDSAAACLGEGLLVYLAVQKQRAGLPIEAVYDWAMEGKNHIAHHFTVDDLNFLKRGGRISATSAILGSMLSVKPLLTVDGEGKLVAYSKVRGRSHAVKAFLDTLEKEKAADCDTIFIAHADCEKDGEAIADTIRTRYPDLRVELSPIGPVIGAHAGPGTLALFFLSENSK